MFHDGLHLMFSCPFRSCHLHVDVWRDISLWKSWVTFVLNKTAKFINSKRKKDGWGGTFHFQHVVRNEWATVWRKKILAVKWWFLIPVSLICHSNENRQTGSSRESWGALEDGSRFGMRAESSLSPLQTVFAGLPTRHGILEEPLITLYTICRIHCILPLLIIHDHTRA